MCRVAAVVSDSQVSLSRLLFDGDHPLSDQAFRPRELIHGLVNVDGTGVAWWPEPNEPPVRYLTERTPWADPNLPSLAPRIHSSTVLATVRSASPGIPFGPANVQPFVHGEVAGAHNGWIGGFRAGTGRKLLELLPDHLFAEMAALNDSLALFLSAVACLEQGATPAQALVEVVDRVGSTLTGTGEPATLNLFLAHAGRVVAFRTSHEAPVNSLYAATSGDGTQLASEPLDTGSTWERIPEHHLVAIEPAGFSILTPEEIR